MYIDARRAMNLVGGWFKWFQFACFKDNLKNSIVIGS